MKLIWILSLYPISISRATFDPYLSSIDGSFELPPLAQLNMEDQIFVAAFVKSHGSIKDMEELYGVSYPSIKNRLNRISKAFDFIDITPDDPTGDILDDLDKGNISFDQAMKALNK